MIKKNIWITLTLLLVVSITLAQKVKYHDPDITTKDDDKTINSKFQHFQSSYVKKMEQVEDAPADNTLEKDLEEYKQHIFSMIVKRGKYQEQIAQVQSHIQQHDGRQTNITPVTENKNILKSKDSQSFISLESSFVGGVDDPKFFFDKTAYTTNISSIPLSGKVSWNPWSSTWWPMDNGGVSVRYGKKSTQGVNWGTSVFLYGQPWEHKEYLKISGYSKYVNEVYSPAEKYDLVMGDYSFSLTNQQKMEGSIHAKGGVVPNWYGICHGWCIAAYLFRRPQRPVTLIAADGRTRVKFLPDDIKGLASLYWANAKYTTRWIGAQCANCPSLNPGSFIIAVGNRVGLQGQHLVFDPSDDGEVWNQPLESYSLRYYDVSTNRFSSNALSVRTTIATLRRCGSQWCNQILATVSPKARSVVGVFIRAVYTVETELIHSDQTKPDKTQTGNWDGYVELDASGNIIGGDWRYAKHPNFIWRPDENEPVEGGISDKDITFFGGSTGELRSMTKFAVRASQQGQPLKAFVDYLINLSS